MNTNVPFSNSPSTDTDNGFVGTLKNIQLNDLIQICCLSASSLCMRVTKSGRQGTIFIMDGEIVHAVCEEMAGEEAFYRILGWQTGSFESLEISEKPKRTIERNYQFLLMEAARRVDERELTDQAAEEENNAIEAVDKRLRVLIVDDSPIMRKILSRMLDASHALQVVGMAGNGREAIQMVDQLSPDLITLDINMPVMDGISTIKHIMIRKPCPVVIMSNASDGSSKTIFNFLELGAVDFISKPINNKDILQQQTKILECLKMAATAKVGNFRIPRLPTSTARPHLDDPPDDVPCKRLVMVISGPGGHPELITLLADLAPVLRDVQGALIVLHRMPSSLGAPMSHYLSQRCGIPAQFVDATMALRAGGCYIGRFDRRLGVGTTDDGPAIEVATLSNGEAPPDGLLKSAATVFGKALAVVLLSGAPIRNPEGLNAVRAAGGWTLVRERTTTMVAGPLDQMVNSGLTDVEVDPAGMVATIRDRLSR
ncbi:response regulator [Desulfosarcina cetonica]